VEVPENMIRSKKYFGRRDIVTLACDSLISSASIFSIDFYGLPPVEVSHKPVRKFTASFHVCANVGGRHNSA
jgi:hypothetical protein